MATKDIDFSFSLIYFINEFVPDHRSESVVESMDFFLKHNQH